MEWINLHALCKQLAISSPAKQRSCSVTSELVEQNKRAKTISVVGVVFSIQKFTIKFFVYDFEARKFTRQLNVSRRKFPSSCEPGTWVRLLLFDDINLDNFGFMDAHSLNPRRVVDSKRRMGTRVWDNSVNFFVYATRKEGPIGSIGDGLFYYNCRLGLLKLTRAELMYGVEVDGKESEMKSEDEVPEQLKLWCTPNGPAEAMFTSYRVTRIDARIWACSHDTESDSNGEVQGNAEVLAADKANAVQRPHLSVAFSSWFSELVENYYLSKRLTSEKREKVEIFVTELTEKLKKETGALTMEIAVFGSVNSGFGTNDCDLDLCLVKTGLDAKPSTQRKRWLSALVDFLQKSKEYTGVSVPEARTPIVKFGHPATKFHGDISIENKLAVYNTELLRLYTEFDERVAPLGVAIKRLAKMCGVNDASTGSISSYAYIVMLIHVLQRVEPPVLPFLQNGSEGKLVDGWNVSFERNFVRDASFCNTQSIAELFIDFLHYYANEFDFTYEVVQIRTRDVYDKYSRGDDCFREQLCVEDPFDLGHNLTSGVREDTLHYISKCFRGSIRGIEKIDREHFRTGKCTELPKTDFEEFMKKFKHRREARIGELSRNSDNAR
uniref:PAP-associated domain-containing protein n=1 Tax=Globodera rostochiensis TaxID=31243 RepID=A0A914I935_GLORO